MQPYNIIGAGLAGCECALTLARHGLPVKLFEQKPLCHSSAHVSNNFSELVCSNSLRSNEISTGVGLLKTEMRNLGSNFMAVAEACAVPAGKALAVDREKFAAMITRQIEEHPLVEVIPRQIAEFDELNNDGAIVIIAAGPLASAGLSDKIAALAGSEHCFFYDAIAPIVWTHSLNMDIVFRASRYDMDDENAGDYLNCPMNREEYENFYNELVKGEIWHPHAGETEKHFEGCMPIEALAARGFKTLVFGPMKPVGLIDPRSGKRPWAVVQLRAENTNLETCNLVGFQTKLLQKEQQRIFRLVPGLEQAEFARYGSMHRNTFVNAPCVLTDNLAFKNNSRAYLIGQLTGVEGYLESAATGLWLALQLIAKARNKNLELPPQTTALGALLGHLRAKTKNFQPSNINFGLMPELEQKAKKAQRKLLYSQRAQEHFKDWFIKNNIAEII